MKNSENHQIPPNRVYYLYPTDASLSAIPVSDKQEELSTEGIRKMQFYEKNKPISDFIEKRGLDGTWTVNQGLKEKIDEKFGTKLTWKPVFIEEEKYWTVYPPVIDNIINTNSSTLLHYPDGSFNKISRIAFIKEKINTFPALFKHKHTGGHTFCTNEFAEWVRTENLTGLQFILAWQEGVPAFDTSPVRDEVLSRPDVFGPNGLQPRRLDWWPDEWLQQVTKGHPAYREVQKEIRARIRRAERIAKAPKRVVVIEPLTEDQLEGMVELLADGRKRVGVTADTPPLECADAVMNYIRQARIERLGPEDQRPAVPKTATAELEGPELAAVFGEAWNRHFGWDWVNLTIHKGLMMTVLANPDRSLYVHVGLNIKLALTHWGAPFKGRLTWSMLDKTDEITPQPPGQMLDLLDSIHFILPPV